jgi:hypothetical protein
VPETPETLTGSLAGSVLAPQITRGPPTLDPTGPPTEVWQENEHGEWRRMPDIPCGIPDSGPIIRCAWRVHGPWCVGPSTIPATRDLLLDGRTLGTPVEVLTCALRYCAEREALILWAEADPARVWQALVFADARPRSSSPVGERARLEAENMIRTYGPR